MMTPSELWTGILAMERAYAALSLIHISEPTRH